MSTKRKGYPSDVSDEEWGFCVSYLFTPPPDPVGDCFNRCMAANGYQFALAGLGLGYGSGGATIPIKVESGLLVPEDMGQQGSAFLASHFEISAGC
jgi:hypothetical protein